MCIDPTGREMKVRKGPKRNYFRMTLVWGALAFAAGMFGAPTLRAQTGVPKFEVDPYWPKPLPERWVTGEIGGVCIDSQDHVFVVQRVSDVGGMDGHLEGLTGDE